MKRTMTFRFQKTLTPIESETGYYFCELSFTNANTGKRRPQTEQTLTTYLMTRDYEGLWRIVGSKKNLPSWLYNYETQFGEAIDESLGIKAVGLRSKTG